MQIQNVTLSQNNYSQKHNPNFTAIRSVKCEGLYKKYPELANNLVSAFKENPTAMAFCKKYDVDIVFAAIKQMQDTVESSIHIVFDNISKSKVRRFFEGVLGKNDDKVVLHAWGNEYSLPCSIEKSTQNLAEHISPEVKTAEGYRGGMLDSHLKNAEERIQTALNKRLEKISKKKAKAETAKAAPSMTCPSSLGC